MLKGISVEIAINYWFIVIFSKRCVRPDRRCVWAGDSTVNRGGTVPDECILAHGTCRVILH